MSTVKVKQKIPKGWKLLNISKVADVVMGQSPSSSSYNQIGEGLPFFQGKADFADSYKTVIRQWTSEPTKLSEVGDILLSVRAPVGDVAINNTEVCIGRGLAAIRAKEKISNQQFLFYVLQSLKASLNTKAQGSTFTAINGPALRTIPVSIPPLPEQKKIAEILGAVDEEIEKTAEIIVATEKLKKGLMQKLFTRGIGHTKFKKTKFGEIPKAWEIEALKDVASVERGKFSHRPRNEPKFYGGDVPFIQTGDVVKSFGRIKTYTQTLNEQGLAISRKFPKGTIVLTIAANIGDTGILEFDACFPDSLVGITTNKSMNNIFLEYFLRTRKDYLNSIATQSAQKNINLQKLNPMLVIKPAKEEQEMIAEILSSVDKKISINKKSKEKLTKLKKGLMQDLLSGGKRV